LDGLTRALHLRELDALAVLDILILAWLIYRFLRVVRGTRAQQMITAVLVVALVHFVTAPGLADFRAIHTALGYLLLYIPFAIIVLFQNPIRQTLALFRWNPLTALGRRRSHERLAEEIALAATSLAGRNIGALIVIERKLGLRAFYDTGIALDALVSYDLLMNIFTPGSPLHDGATIISEGRIKAASCYVPLTTDPDVSSLYGARHRAAVGITEESDAVAVVVSEERGIVSLAWGGRILESLGARELTTRLEAALAPGAEGQPPGQPSEREVAKSTHA
jgi:diadenylate cyclase